MLKINEAKMRRGYMHTVRWYSLFVIFFLNIFLIPQSNALQSATSNDQQTSALSSAAPTSQSWLTWISSTMQETNSVSVRIFLVFLLGLLMSLTPCIYPMIPITAGILQTQTSRSLLTSFLLSLSYTVGIATTFAVLGLLAAFAGQAMGNLMSQPLFIVPLVGLLFYLALSMIGVYEMYIPRFLQPRDHTINSGSFISAFTFGAVSGIIASPCLSPGLVCLLCLVTTLGSKLMGFVLLFSFGIGLGVPLLIIGTFSSSLSLLPRAGMWMVEVKKIFGFFMLAMCLYFLNFITPSYIMEWVIVCSAFLIGIAFLFMAIHAYTKTWRYLYTLLCIFLITSSALLAYKQLKNRPLLPENQWHTDYAHALLQAQQENKYVFLDIGAPYCSICKAIDATLFSNKRVKEFLETRTMPVKLDGSLAQNKQLLEQFKVIGFPTILLINPKSQAIIKHWGPELYSIAPEQFIDQLNQALS